MVYYTVRQLFERFREIKTELDINKSIYDKAFPKIAGNQKEELNILACDMVGLLDWRGELNELPYHRKQKVLPVINSINDKIDISMRKIEEPATNVYSL